MNRFLVTLHTFFFLQNFIGYSQEFSIKHIDYSYGLSNSQIQHVVEDSMGFMWLGTRAGGIYRWDGYSLDQLPKESRYDEILALESNRFGVYYSSPDFLHKIGSSEIIEKKKNMKDISNIFSLGNRLVVLFRNGRVKLLDSESLSIMDSLDMGTSIHFFEGYKMSDTSIYVFAVNTSLCINLKANDKLDLVELHLPEQIKFSGKLEFWKLTHTQSGFVYQVGKQLFFLDRKLNHIKTIHFPIDVNIGAISYFKEFYWIGTRQGLYQMNVVEDSFNIVEELIPYPVVNLKIKDDILFAGTFNGLFEIISSEVNSIKIEKSDFKSNYFAFLSDSIDMLGGNTTHGIDVFRKSQIVDSIKFDDVKYNYVRSFLRADDDSIFVGSQGGLIKLNPKTHKYRKLENINSPVLSIGHSENTVCFGTASKGIYILNGEKWHQNKLIDTDQISPAVWSIKNIGEAFFIGTSQGLFKFSQNKISKINLEEGFNQIPITAIEKLADSSLAIGFARGGVVIYNHVKNEISNVYTDENGLSSSYIFFLKKLDKQLWIGSSLGVDILCLADSNFFSLKDYVQIGGAETFLNGIYSTDSSVWISTIAGTIIVPKNIINIASEKPRNPVVINRVDVFSNSGSIQSYYSKDFNSLRLSHKSNNIAIHFKVAEYGVSKSTYKYTLEGLSNQILKVNDNKTIVYRNLLPGEYCFKVWRSSSSKNLIPKDKALISFEIVSPFYQKTLFQVIAILFLLVLVMLFTWYRSRFIIAKSLRKERLRQEAQDDLRKDMAIDFHDELGNHLAKIINLSSVLRLQNLDEKHLGILTRIEHSANELFVSTKNLIWSMKNENNNLHKIFYHLRDFSERLYDRTNVKLSFFNSSEETYSKINPKQSRDLSLILKEAITNSFKHSLSNTLEVSLKSLSDGESWFEIIDTGQGFDIDRIDVSSGLRNMQLRAGRSNFDLNIESHLNKGTRIKIKIKQA